MVFLCGVSEHMNSQSRLACRAQISVAVRETSSFAKQASNEEEAQMIGQQDPADRPPKNDCKIRQRRKLEHGNKGKVAWNKGKKHSAETRARIKQRTIEALSNPKLREKMSVNPRPHSDRTKARIQTSLRRVWDKRLKWKQSREKLHRSWLESIENYAKRGGENEEELDWDSYDKLNQKIAAQQLRWAADKAKAIEMSQSRRERIVEARVEKIARIAQRRKEREERDKLKSKRKPKALKKSKKDEVKPAGIKGLKLKRRLIKVHRRKILNGQTTTIRGDAMISHIAAGDELDIEFLKRERSRRAMSLADQIQKAKTKRADSTHMKVLSASCITQPYKNPK